MLRSHRKIHLFMWAALSLLIALGFIAGIQARKPMPKQEPPVIQQLPATNPPATEVKDK